MGLSGNTADVRFDFEGSLRLARALWAFADDLESAKESRRSQAEGALRSWRGKYGEQFRDRVDDEQVTMAQIAAALRSEADGWAMAWKQAMDEQNRRLWARRVEQEKEDRSTLEKFGDWLTGYDAPPPPAPVAKPAPGMFHSTACLGG